MYKLKCTNSKLKCTTCATKGQKKILNKNVRKKEKGLEEETHHFNY